MNNLINNLEPTMSSRDIAEMTGKEHRNVMADIRKMLGELYGEGGVLKFEHTLTNPQNGQAYPIFRLPKRESLILVSGYSVAMRAKIIDRWQELEAAAKPALPQTYLEALRALVHETEQNEALKTQIEADRPKVEFALAVRNLDGSCLVREFAKVIGFGQNKLFARLRDDGYLMVNNLPYQEFIDRGWFVVVEGTPFTDSKGKSHPTFTTRITGKDQVALEKKLRNKKKPSADLVLIQGGASA